MHAAALARELEIPYVLVPPNPGLTSAMGLLQTQVRHVYLRSSVGLVSAFSLERMEAHFVDLADRAMADVAEEGFASDSVSIRRQCDMRYLHQGYQLAIDCPTGTVNEESDGMNVPAVEKETEIFLVSLARMDRKKSWIEGKIVFRRW